jgi:hypothetical protein
MERTGTVPVCHKSIQSASQPASQLRGFTEGSFADLPRVADIRYFTVLLKSVANFGSSTFVQV